MAYYQSNYSYYSGDFYVYDDDDYIVAAPDFPDLLTSSYPVQRNNTVPRNTGYTKPPLHDHSDSNNNRQTRSKKTKSSYSNESHNNLKNKNSPKYDSDYVTTRGRPTVDRSSFYDVDESNEMIDFAEVCLIEDIPINSNATYPTVLPFSHHTNDNVDYDKHLREDRKNYGNRSNNPLNEEDDDNNLFDLIPGYGNVCRWEDEDNKRQSRDVESPAVTKANSNDESYITDSFNGDGSMIVNDGNTVSDSSVDEEDLTDGDEEEEDDDGPAKDDDLLDDLLSDDGERVKKAISQAAPYNRKTYRANVQDGYGSDSSTVSSIQEESAMWQSEYHRLFCRQQPCPESNSDHVILDSMTTSIVLPDNNNTNNTNVEEAQRLARQRMEEQVVRLRDLLEEKNEEIETLNKQLRRAVSTKCDLVSAHAEVERYNDVIKKSSSGTIKQGSKEMEKELMKRANYMLLEEYSKKEKELLSELMTLSNKIKDEQKKYEKIIEDMDLDHRNEILEKDFQIAQLTVELQTAKMKYLAIMSSPLLLSPNEGNNNHDSTRGNNSNRKKKTNIKKMFHTQ